jgi:hypothetical protein
MALELLRSGSAGLLDNLLLLSFAGICGWYEK